MKNLKIGLAKWNAISYNIIRGRHHCYELNNPWGIAKR